MPTLTATAFPNIGATQLVLDWRDNPAVSLVSMFCRFPNGSDAELRGSPMYLSGGLAVAWDSLPPLNSNLTYWAVTTQAVTGSNVVFSNTISVSGFGWIKDPITPVNDVELVRCSPQGCASTPGDQIILQSLGDEEFADVSGLFQTVDSSRGMTVSQRRQDASSEFRLISRTLDDIERLKTVFSPGRVLALELPTDYGWAYKTCGLDYIKVGNVTMERIHSSNMNKTYRLWTIPYTLTRPQPSPSGFVGGNGVGVRGATWGDLFATGKTWGDLVSSGRTWLDIAKGVF